MSVRTATLHDNDALCRLARRAPMSGAVRYCLERDPDFFALTRLQGADAEVLVVDAPSGGELAAMGTHVPLVRSMGASATPVSYLGDLKIDPLHRGRRLAGALLEAASARLEASDAAFGIALVLAGNDAMEGIVGHRARALRFERLTTLRNYSVFFAWPGSLAGTTRRATEDDVPEMVALSNRTGAERDLTCMWTELSFRARIAAMGLSLDAFHVIERRGSMTAFGVVWDASAIKRVRLLGLGPSLALLRSAHGAFARMAGVPPIPRNGGLLPFGYVTHFAAERSEDLRALLVALLRERQAKGHLYLDFALDVRDPLRAALDGLATTHIDFDLHAVHRAGDASLRTGTRPLGFDMAFV